MSSLHTLSVLVEDRPGVLTRVAGLFAARGFNIDSLAVGPTEKPGVSRMTIVVTVDKKPLEQITKQLNKLINVIKILEHEPRTTVERELMLVKVRAEGEARARVLEFCQVFRCACPTPRIRRSRSRRPARRTSCRRCWSCWGLRHRGARPDRADRAHTWEPRHPRTNAAVREGGRRRGRVVGRRRGVITPLV
jgi:acetolactate synthase small subunit